MSVQQKIVRPPAEDVASGRIPDMTMLSGAPLPDAAAEQQAKTKRPFIIRYGKHLRGFFDRVVGVAEIELQQRRQLASDGALAHAHHADEHDGPVHPRDEFADFGIGEARRVQGHCRQRYS